MESQKQFFLLEKRHFPHKHSTRPLSQQTTIYKTVLSRFYRAHKREKTFHSLLELYASMDERFVKGFVQIGEKTTGKNRRSGNGSCASR